MLDAPISVILKHKGREVYSVSSQTNVYDCTTKLKEFNIGALVVVDDGKLQGIVSERDIIRKLIGCHCDPGEVKVADVMTADVWVLSPESLIQEAMSVMTTNRVRHIPILDAAKKLVGLISIGDITKYIMVNQEYEIGALTEYIHGAR